MLELGNENVKSLQPSATVSMSIKANQMKKNGIDIINLAGGDPDFDTPEPIKRKAIEAIQQGHTHYAMGVELLPLKEGIVKKLKTENHIDVSTDQIILTPGGKYALFLTIQALLNPGDEVLIVAPTWVSYEPMVIANNATPVFLELEEKDNYTLTKEKLLSHTTDKTKLVIICSPNNPTGHDLSKQEIEDVVDYIKESHVHILIDEMYEHLVYEKEHISLASYQEISDYVISVFGFSKSYAMTGWRLGYVIAQPQYIHYMNKVYQHSITTVNTFVQEAATVALTCHQDVQNMKKAYQIRRDRFIKAMNEIPGVHALQPEGAFYAWVRFEKEGLHTSIDICNFLLDEAKVAGAPGIAFGCTDEKHVRFSIASSDEDLQEAVKRIKVAMKKNINKND